MKVSVAGPSTPIRNTIDIFTPYCLFFCFRKIGQLQSLIMTGRIMGVTRNYFFDATIFFYPNICVIQRMSVAIYPRLRTKEHVIVLLRHATVIFNGYFCN